MRGFKGLAPALILATAACTSSEQGSPSAESTTAPTATTSPATASVVGKLARMRFDMLGGGDSRIFVYPGTSESPADKAPYESIYYYDGQEVDIECQKQGRIVKSHSDVGEQQERASDIWYRLAGKVPVQYATATYAEVVSQGVIIPDCPGR